MVRRILLIWFVFCFWLAPITEHARAQELAEHRPGEVIVKFQSTIATVQAIRTLSNVGITVLKQLGSLGVYHCNIGTKDINEAITECEASPNVVYAEPNYIYRHFDEPNDPRFDQLYGMTITDAPAAWDIQTGRKSIIVGVIDTGADWDHPDLAGNIWNNSAEIPNNNIDDDKNGFVDDFLGWDFANDDNNPDDDNDHGSHVSGTIGAVGNNGVGVVGVNWKVSIMPLKFLDNNGSGSLDDALEAIIYGVNNGAKVLSNSWGGGGFSQALEDAIKFANDNGVLFVAAAGNDSKDNDDSPSYPANYEVPNVISVAASTRSDNLASFSNTGRTTVHLAAPGQDILSTTKQNTYSTFSGTSMATPHVAGAAALVWAQFPGLSMAQVKIRVLGGIDRVDSFNETTSTGGRLNVFNSLSTNPVIVTTRLQNTLDETRYTVNSDILDDGGSVQAILYYQVSGQSTISVNMSSVGSDQYVADIPGQSLGSTIIYNVTATDNDGNLTVDSDHTFQIAEPPPDEPSCGFSRPATFFILPLAIIGFWRRKKK